MYNRVMFFADHEKLVYTPPGSEKSFDPLAVSRRLVLATAGRLDELLTLWQSGLDGSGDISGGHEAREAVDRAGAEEQLAKAARVTFELPEFPECTDGAALEWLLDYLWWMEKKGSRGETPPPSPSGSASTGP